MLKTGVAITLRNDNNADVQVAFPAGTILKSRSGKLQNGILVKKTTFLIPKNSQKRVHLFMYCGNYSRHASSPSEIYDWSVITTSRSLHNLFDLLIDKKINIEQYLSSRSEIEKYANIVNKIQSIIWQITDWEHGLTESDKKYLEALPIE
ncbi:hypothetical protein [Sphingobacterium hotanense]|uniref:hypothetical protein n=1 Tax=Sphingobacterium hotanense TaxID=649196 RepID=UPI0021A29C41|nr:hypothetical protein [Sphingobacterium hotanense]MCT1524203.1 hypothetical protein [Sphingobacterium hotanense]